MPTATPTPTPRPPAQPATAAVALDRYRRLAAANAAVAAELDNLTADLAQLAGDRTRLEGEAATLRAQLLEGGKLLETVRDELRLAVEERDTYRARLEAAEASLVKAEERAETLAQALADRRPAP